MLEAALSIILNHGLEFVIGLIALGLGKLSAGYLSLVNRKVKDEVAREALQQLASVVRGVADRLEQELVPKIKELNADGKLTPEDRAILRKNALSLVKSAISDQLMSSIKHVVGLTENQIDDAIVMMLEAYLQRKKQGRFW
jgi:hypothetical protein